MENKIEATIVHWGYTGIMEKKMETTIVHWGYVGIKDNKLETIISGLGFQAWGSVPQVLFQGNPTCNLQT